MKTWIAMLALALLVHVRLDGAPGPQPGTLLDPLMLGAERLEGRAVTFGHVRMCLTLAKDAGRAQSALETILAQCPDFFASRELPHVFARALESEFHPASASAGGQMERARERLVALGKGKLLNNGEFRNAVVYYVYRAGLLEQGEAHLERAAPVLARLRERENALLCGEAVQCLSVAFSGLSTPGTVPAPGPLPAALLARPELARCVPQVCPSTGKAEYTWNGQRVLCATHGTAPPPGPLPPADTMEKAMAKNPMIWAVDHLRRSLAAEAAMHGLKRGP